MKITFNKKRFLFYIYVGIAYSLIWLLSALINYASTFFLRAINYAWYTIYIVVLNFILFEYIMPFISRKRKNIILNILIAIPIIWLMLMLYSVGLYAWRYIGILLHIYTSLISFTTMGHAIAYHFPFSLVSVFFFAIVNHVNYYIQLKQAAQQLRIEKQAAELNYLKSQTNPHFLFNTLNNIYSLARDKSDLAPESIMRLSKILRFMLYETSGEFIAVGQELKIITDYIELERLRYDETLHINFIHDIEDMKQALPPLLLIPMVENAFKHGVSETRDHPYVNIHLSINKRQLTFSVKNSSDSASEGNVKENIGLSNLRRQLELLYKDYELSVQPGISQFTATLKINLSSHV